MFYLVFFLRNTHHSIKWIRMVYIIHVLLVIPSLQEIIIQYCFIVAFHPRKKKIWLVNHFSMYGRIDSNVKVRKIFFESRVNPHFRLLFLSISLGDENYFQLELIYCWRYNNFVFWHLRAQKRAFLCWIIFYKIFYLKISKPFLK